MPSAKSSPPSSPMELISEGQRAMRLCNACRYCEGFCAVFPAMERRLAFSEQDLNYLANLCHDCGECYYSCQYAPPHEFALNLPQTLAEIRAESYRKYAWPGFFAGLFRRNGLAVSLAMAAGPILFLLLTLLFTEPSVLFSAHSVAEGSFYRVMSHRVMTVSFGAVGLYVLAALVMGFAGFGARRAKRGARPCARAPWDRRLRTPCGSVTSTGAVTAAPIPTRRLPMPGGGFTILRFTDSCCASRQPPWLQSTITFSAGKPPTRC